ncbi:MAG: FAD-binding oxidoreductase [Pseudomonadota bacterium]
MAIGNKPDVIIVGAGIFGLACAYACAKRRLKTLVLDAGEIGQGASSGIVGAMAPHTPDQWNPKKQFQYDALAKADDFWAEVDTQSGCKSGYARIGRLIPILSEKEHHLATARIDAAQRNWNGFDWKIVENDTRFAPGAFGFIHETLSARIFPRHAVQSLMKACASMGVTFQTQTRVTALDDHKVTTSSGELSAAAIILSGGVEGFHLLDYHLGAGSGSGVKGQAALLDFDLGDAPQIYADNLYIIPHENGTTAIGSTSENRWGQPFETDHQLDELLQRAYAICPQLKDADVIERWAGLRPKARRRDPMLGAMPDLSGIFVATGAFKIGFGIAHLVGERMSQLILGESADIPASFSIEHHMA